MNDVLRIFIGSSRESLQVANGIKANFEYDNVEVRIWNEDMFTPGEYTLDELMRFTKSFDFGIFVWANDDTVESRNQVKSQPRDNVILEAGMFYGALGKSRVFLFAPLHNEPKIASDLLGLTPLRYVVPSDDNYQAALATGVNKLKKKLFELGKARSNELQIRTYPDSKFKNLQEAKSEIIKECLAASEIKILSNKGLEFFGSDNSIVALCDSQKFTVLKRLRILMLSPNSTWINRGLMALRKYEKLEDFINELKATQTIVEMGLQTFLKDINIEDSGVKYHLGEPCFRFILTDTKVFVSSYAENPSAQVKELPVYVFNNEFGSMYGSLRRHFHDLWKNNSENGLFLQKNIEVEVAAGGIIHHTSHDGTFIALVQRDDGSWILPKGHKKKSEQTLEETAIREVSEETGIAKTKIKCLKKVDSYSYDETARHLGVNKINHFYFMACVDDNQPELKTDPEHRLAKWWNIKDEFPFMFYSYQKIMLSQTIKSEFDVDIRINPK